MPDWTDPEGGKPTSIWKKEISFKRKPKQEKPAAEPAEQTSVWKKEIHPFGRKANAEPAPAEAPPEQTSVWKKEISFKRKPKAERPASSSAEYASIWKKELHLFGGRAKAEPSAEAGPAAAEAPDAPLEPAAPVAEVLDAPEPETEPQVVALPEAPLAEVEAPEHGWLTAPLDEISLPPDEPEVEEPEHVAAWATEPAPDPEHVAVEEPEPALDPEPIRVEQPEPVPLLPPLPAGPPLVPAAVVLPPSPPLPALAAPHAPEPAPEKVPLLKRELSFKRKPRASKEPKPEKKPKHTSARQPKQEKTSLLKRELSFKRKPRPAAEPKHAQPKEKKPPLLKRELSLKRKPRAERAPKTVQPARGKRERVAPKEKRLVGLKIGASQIAAARVANNGSIELLEIVRAPLDPGIVVGGELRDPEALAVALRDFFRKYKLPKKSVRLGVANNRIGVRTFEIGGIDDPKQLENAIRYRAQEVLPIPLEEAVLDYQILSETVRTDGSTTRRILLVVAYRDLVDRYVGACRKAGINLVGIDLEAFALLRALAPPLDPAATGGERAAFVAVSVGYDRSTFAVSDGRVCEFTRVLEWGGYALDVGIARALDLTPVEAEEIKYALSLATPGALPEGLSAEQATAAREAVERQLQTFARELVSSLQFYQSQPGSLPIGELVLTGGTAQLPGLAAELERLIGVPVRIGDPLGRVKVSKKVRDREQTGSFAIAIGLGIED